MQEAKKALTLPEELDGKRLDGIVRELFEVSWGQSRRWIDSGKIFVDELVVLEQSQLVPAGAKIELRESAARPRASEIIDKSQILHLDAQVIVVLKPADVLTVPFEKQERGTLVDGVRTYLSRQERRGRGKHGPRPQLFVVQRLDRGTTGVLVFARTWSAAQRLRDQFRAHQVHRRYLALAHGHVTGCTIRSHLLLDRGDGLRGSRERAVRKALRKTNKGKFSVTHVEVLERYGAPEASLIECRLETGRTNQIRIHLSEAGHPLLGEKTYLRGYRGQVVSAPRLMLHAGELGFQHPKTGREHRFEAPLPEDMSAVLTTLRRRLVERGAVKTKEVSTSSKMSPE